jgi:hypothetical protein
MGTGRQQLTNQKEDTVNQRYYLQLGLHRVIYGPYADDEIKAVARLKTAAQAAHEPLYATRANSFEDAVQKFNKVRS